MAEAAKVGNGMVVMVGGTLAVAMAERVAAPEEANVMTSFADGVELGK